LSPKARKAKVSRKKVVLPGKIVENIPSRGPVEKILDTKVSKRTLLKGTVVVGAAAAVTALGLAASKPKSSAQSAEAIPTAAGQTAISMPTSTSPFAEQSVTFTVNGTSYTATVEPRDMLANVLRDSLGLVGTKMGCNRMMCGACTVLMDGKPIESCQFPAMRAGGHSFLTVEGGVPTTSPTGTVTVPADPVIAALQAAWVQNDGGQCAYCGAGNIMAAAGLLKANPTPTVDEIKAALSGNLCRCGNYLNIIASVQAAAEAL